MAQWDWARPMTQPSRYASARVDPDLPLKTRLLWRRGTRIALRRQAQYDKITGFLKEHSKAGRCRYSKLLLASYPDAPVNVVAAEEPETKKASEKPSSVEEWLAWE